MADQKLGQMHPIDAMHGVSRVAFLVRQFIHRLRTNHPVKVVASTANGDVAPPGFVDVAPLVNMLDGKGAAYEMGTVYRVPFYRVQGGDGAIIIDPQPGDIGVVAIADRDITGVKNKKDRANPGSWRNHDFSDSMYVASMLNASPEQYVRFHPNGIDIKDRYGNMIIMNSDGIKINGVLFQQGHADQDFWTHKHDGVSTGGGISGNVVG